MTARPKGETATEITVLVVDDAAVDRRMTGAIIENNLGWRVEYAENGASALAAMERETPRLVLTDLRMPGMDGLELVTAVRDKYPSVPVVLMTAYGNEEIAIQALRAGAASYVPKKSLDHDLAPTLEQVMAAAQTERRQQRLLQGLANTESHFVLENDRTLIPALVVLIQEYLVRLGLCDQTDRIRVGVALEEALLNAILHGNLELNSALRQQGDDPYYRLADERRQQSPYRDRQVHFTYKLSRSEAVFAIRDEGPGFDPDTLPDPTDPTNLGQIGGRGLLLIRTFMDEVTFSKKGNQITLIKRRAMNRGEGPRKV
jgi:CheY-like chemotaxis protein/anti-sigma regulatory factor (Ser/Thr protein kinase)